jgi:hypothetical protein
MVSTVVASSTMYPTDESFQVLDGPHSLSDGICRRWIISTVRDTVRVA